MKDNGEGAGEGCKSFRLQHKKTLQCMRGGQELGQASWAVIHTKVVLSGHLGSVGAQISHRRSLLSAKMDLRWYSCCSQSLALEQSPRGSASGQMSGWIS